MTFRIFGGALGSQLVGGLHKLLTSCSNRYYMEGLSIFISVVPGEYEPASESSYFRHNSVGFSFGEYTWGSGRLADRCRPISNRFAYQCRPMNDGYRRSDESWLARDPFTFEACAPLFEKVRKCSRIFTNYGNCVYVFQIVRTTRKLLKLHQKWNNNLKGKARDTSVVDALLGDVRIGGVTRKTGHNTSTYLSQY